MTAAETALWRRLRNRRFHGLKFRRQARIERYVVDFLCIEAGLIVEIDGSQHVDAARYDARRTGALERCGFLVLRFWNNEVLSDIDRVLAAIANTLPPESTGEA